MVTGFTKIRIKFISALEKVLQYSKLFIHYDNSWRPDEKLPVATCAEPCFQNILELLWTQDHLSLAAIVMQLARVECYAGCITCDDRSAFRQTCFYAFIPLSSAQPWGWRSFTLNNKWQEGYTFCFRRKRASSSKADGTICIPLYNIKPFL
jgi:hypothetical protein